MGIAYQAFYPLPAKYSHHFQKCTWPTVSTNDHCWRKQVACSFKWHDISQLLHYPFPFQHHPTSQHSYWIVEHGNSMTQINHLQNLIFLVCKQNILSFLCELARLCHSKGEARYNTEKDLQVWGLKFIGIQASTFSYLNPPVASEIWAP